MVSLTAEVARTYLSLRGAQRQRAIVQADIADEQQLLKLTNSRSDNGFSSQADSVQQQAQLSASEAQLPPIDQNIDQAMNRLALLLALPPGALAERLGDLPRNDVALPPEVPVGLPGDLLRRRPDILKSEADLHAATAKVGQAQAQLFPSITLGGTAGLQSIHASSLTDLGLALLGRRRRDLDPDLRRRQAQGADQDGRRADEGSCAHLAQHGALRVPRRQQRASSPTPMNSATPAPSPAS